MNEIFKYQDSRQFLKDVIEKKKSMNYRLSLRSVARQVGTTAATLSTYLNGKKNISLETARKISMWLKLSDLEKEVFLNLVELDNCKDIKVRQEIADFINLRSIKNSRTKSHSFHLLKDWKKIALMACFQSPSLRKKTIPELAQMLDVSTDEISDCLKDLTENDIIYWNNFEGYVLSTGISFESEAPQEISRGSENLILKISGVSHFEALKNMK